MNSLYNNKKLLVLGGRPIGSIELVQRAKELGCYVIVADYLADDESPAKKYADESWLISTAEVNELAENCRKHHVDGILTAVHEFNINRMRELCTILDLPCYCAGDAWKYCDNKSDFKSLCKDNGISVANLYYCGNINNFSCVNIKYPVAVKPVDGSGSRGFSVCKSEQNLKKSMELASRFSPSKKIIIEDYIPYESVIIHYTIINGVATFCGISDKKSARFSNTDAPVMGIQLFPSLGQDKYIKKYDTIVRRALNSASFQQGPVWIEAFYDGGDTFIFNEMGFRFGGSLTYYPVNYFYNINQLDLLIESAFSPSCSPPAIPHNPSPKKGYCILPVHIRPGIINEIVGEKELKELDSVYAYVPVHYCGDKIEAWGSAQQVFSYIHYIYDDITSLKETIRYTLSILKAISPAGENLLYTLFDTNKL